MRGVVSFDPRRPVDLDGFSNGVGSSTIWGFSSPSEMRGVVSFEPQRPTDLEGFSIGVGSSIVWGFSSPSEMRGTASTEPRGTVDLGFVSNLLRSSTKGVWALFLSFPETNALVWGVLIVILSWIAALPFFGSLLGS